MRATRAPRPSTVAAVRDLSRSQIAVYVAVAVALLLVGARAIRVEQSSGSTQPGQRPSELVDGGAGSREAVRLSAVDGDVVVDVAGAVRNPGVYRLPAGARVVHAIERAGGPDAGAALEAINRAARLTDGQQVTVPRQGPGGSAIGIAGGGDDGPISLGSATVEDLDTIDGIGPVTAQKIVEYRNQRGGLASIEQLDAVSGIGPATMESLRSRLQP